VLKFPISVHIFEHITVFVYNNLIHDRDKNNGGDMRVSELTNLCEAKKGKIIH